MPWLAQCKETYIDFNISTVIEKGQIYYVKKYSNTDDRVLIRHILAKNPKDDYIMSAGEARKHFYKPYWEETKQPTIQGYNHDFIVLDEHSNGYLEEQKEKYYNSITSMDDT
jgi:hypothetical protein